MRRGQPHTAGKDRGESNQGGRSSATQNLEERDVELLPPLGEARLDDAVAERVLPREPPPLVALRVVPAEVRAVRRELGRERDLEDEDERAESERATSAKSAKSAAAAGRPEVRRRRRR